MISVLNSKEMKAADLKTIEYYGVDSLILMEKAALGVASAIEEKFDRPSNILFVCGSGNNGGDGFAAARILYLKGYRVCTCLVGDEKKATPETKKQLDILRKYQITEIDFDEAMASEFEVVVDCIFGNGLCRNIEGHYREVIEKLNEAEGYKVAVDIPSGVSADTGNVLGVAFKADYTISIQYLKVGCVLYPGADYCGKFKVIDIGIRSDKQEAFIPEVKDLLSLNKRKRNSNKSTYGRVLLFVGSPGMAGAAILAAKAAYRCGCGYVNILTCEENVHVLQTTVPEAVLSIYDFENPDFDDIRQVIKKADVIVAGCGISTDTSAERIVKLILEEADMPLVLDADALNIISKDVAVLANIKSRCVITPHPKEMARLINSTTESVLENFLSVAKDFAKDFGVVCHLKGAASVTALPFKEEYICVSGNSGMATAGSGDVLAGVIGGLCATEGDLEKASYMGAFIHGLAGSLAAEEKSETSLMAGDIADKLPEIFSKIETSGH